MSNHKTTMTAIFAVIAIAATVAATGGVVYAQVASDAPQSLMPVDARGQITSQVVSQLLDIEVEPEVKMHNINEAKHLIFGKPVILDTQEVSESIEISDQYNVMTESIRTALFACASVTCNDPTVKATAQELADRVTYWLDVKSSLEEQTMQRNCSVALPQTCEVLNQADEQRIMLSSKTIGEDKIWDGWYREIRSPYYPVMGDQYAYAENSSTSPSIGTGECSTVVKEIQGIQSILRPSDIPIWQEPLSSRAQIIGDSKVWIVEFVPSTFVTNFNYCNVNGEIEFDYDENVIIQRELLHFWNNNPRD